MTVGQLLFSVTTTGYIMVCIYVEEQTPEERFGETYEPYPEETPMLIPQPRTGTMQHTRTMNRLTLVFISLSLITVLVGCSGESNEHRTSSRSPEASAPVTGQGELTFRVLHTQSILPDTAEAVLENAHGGFAIDRREGRGQTYFALPGAGIFRISADLNEVRRLDTPDAFGNANLHNTTIWYGPAGAGYLSFPSNNTNRVLTTTLEGELVHVLSAPSAEHAFGMDSVNAYFREGGAFVPTDVERLGDRLYVTTGYSELDYVLTGNLQLSENGDESAVDVQWSDLAFGGKGTAPGQFGTGHGITQKSGHLHVSDRPHAEVDEFDAEGEYLSTLNLPEGAYPCDIDFGDEYAVVASLHAPDRSSGAPIYILHDREVVSTIRIKDDLGLEKFQHIHNAVLREIDDRLYIIAQSWNPGDFVILEQVVG